jgi:methylenetetrahydrofolate dehydrogenase (NADP+)/methenyltetrahydrofolate cyclohydrolase
MTPGKTAGLVNTVLRVCNLATIIDGKAFSANLRGEIARKVEIIKQNHSLTPGLAVVLVGEDPASQVYVRSKGKQTQEAGMNSYEHKLDASIGQDDLLALIDQLNNDPDVHGILVQLPLPDHIDEEAVINSISVDKDVDGFHLSNVGRLSIGADGIVPCTPLGSLMMLKEHLGDLSGMKAIVVGRSNIVGKPMAALLLKESCTVTIAHSRTRDLPGECRQADIVVAAVGRPEMVKGDWIKPGATVIDVGINRIEKEDGSTRLVGDVEFGSAAEVAGAITPVPGGVGPMTIACLLHNTLQQACRLNHVEIPE